MFYILSIVHCIVDRLYTVDQHYFIARNRIISDKVKIRWVKKKNPLSERRFKTIGKTYWCRV